MTLLELQARAQPLVRLKGATSRFKPPSLRLVVAASLGATAALGWIAWAVVALFQ